MNAIWEYAEAHARISTFLEIQTCIHTAVNEATAGRKGKYGQTRDQIIIEEWLKVPIDRTGHSIEEMKRHKMVCNIICEGFRL